MSVTSNSFPIPDIMNIRIILIVFFSVIALTCAHEITYSACGSPSGEVTKVDVHPCPRQPCKLKIGRNYKIQVTFTSKVQSQSSKAVVHGIIEGLPLPFPFQNDDGCKSGIQCPIEGQKTYDYMVELPVKDYYPELELTIKWELRDDTGSNLFCIMFPVKIRK